MAETGTWQNFELADIVTGDVFTIDAQPVTVNFTDSMGMWDVYGNLWLWQDIATKEIVYVRNIFDD